MNEKNQTIVIQITGDKTIATQLAAGWSEGAIRRSRTTRHPKDQFDAYIAARVALDRLFGKDEERVFRECDEEKVTKGQFQVGDIVRVVNPVPPTFGDYKVGDVAVVTKVDQPALFSDDRFYNIRIRSKERKGNKARVLGQELELVHRGGKKKGGAK